MTQFGKLQDGLFLYYDSLSSYIEQTYKRFTCCGFHIKLRYKNMWYNSFCSCPFTPDGSCYFSRQSSVTQELTTLNHVIL